MFSKILSFTLVYILSIINFLIILTPMAFIFLGEIFVHSSDHYTTSVILLLISGTSFLMLLFLLFDFLFSSSVNFYKKTSTLASKSKDYSIFNEVFEDVKKKFNKNNVKLYINNSSEINAFAVGSLRENIIVLTTGILSSYSKKIESNEKFLLSIKGIIGHEMSHIINKDYFTALLLIVNQKAVGFVSRIIFLLFNIFIRIISLLPLIGNFLSNIIMNIYNIIDWLINFFYKKIMMKIYNFINLQISKKIEYRADNQGAKLIGGKNMAYSLSLLGNNGFFTLFSSHPATKNRVKSVENVEKSEKIKAVFGSNFAFLLSFILIIYTIIITYRAAKLDNLINDINKAHSFFINKFFMMKNYIIFLINKVTNKV